MPIDSRYLKYIATGVLISFIMLILQPTAQALQSTPETPEAASSPIVETTGLTSASPDLLHRLSQQLQTLQAAASNLRSGFQPIDIAPLQATLTQYDGQARTAFAVTADLLQDTTLPPAILARQHQAQQAYERAYQTVADNLAAIASAQTAAAQAAQIEASLNYLNPLLNVKGHTPFNPDEMAFRSPRGHSRVPLENAALRALAPANLRSGDRRTAPNDAALAPTPDVQITEDIQALAASLDYNPVAIYNWVHDNIRYIPTYGSVQGSQLTLDNRAGNAFDTASLLIALLRTSGIHARYAYGTVRIPIDKVMNWVGGVTEPSDAIKIISLGYIPATSLTQGGVIKYVKMEHVWVEAWLDFYPSRGAVHRQGDSWVPIDASFKQYQFIEGLHPEREVPFPTDTLVNQLLDSATFNADVGSVTGMNEQVVEDAVETYEAQLQAWFDMHKPDATVADMLDTAQIIPLKRPFFAGSLPYQLHEYGGAFNALPDNLRHRLTIRLYNSAQARALDNPSLTQTLGFAELGTLRLGLTYVPATQADADALAHFREELAVEGIPAYLFELQPVLTLEDTVLASGQALTMGTTQYYRLTITDPHNTYTHNGQIVAGTEVAFVTNGNGLSPAAVDKRLDSVDWYTPAENLHQLGLHFWMEHDFFDHLAAQAYGVKVQRMPSVGAFTSPFSVTYQFGVPQTGLYKAYQIDVKRNVQTVWSLTDETRFQFLTHIGINGSYIEGSVIEQLFDYEQGRGLSTAQILLDANAQNIPIVHVTAANYGEWADTLSVSTAVRSDIVAAIQTGKEVIIPQRAVQHGAWYGSGYIIQDPLTGEGAYLIEGGLNGSFLELLGCEFSNFPLMQEIVLEVVSALLFYAFMPAITAGAAAMGLSTAMAGASIFAQLVRPIMRVITKSKQFRKAKNKRRQQCKQTTRANQPAPRFCKDKKNGKCGAQFKLVSLSFKNDLTIYKDEIDKALKIVDPVWTDKGKNDAVGYVSGKNIKLVAEFQLMKPPKKPSEVTFHVKATIRGEKQPKAKAPIFADVKRALPANPNRRPIRIEWKAKNVLTAKLIQFFDPLEIDWSATIKEKKSAKQKNVDIEVSKHPVYVTLQAPLIQDKGRDDAFDNKQFKQDSGYLTMLHLATSNPGATSQKQALDNTWKHFSKQNVQLWDGRKLVYYPAGQNAGNCLSTFLGVETWLTDRFADAECSVFQQLFSETLKVNGVKSQTVTVTAKNYRSNAKLDEPNEFVLVNHWAIAEDAKNEDQASLTVNQALLDNRSSSGSYLEVNKQYGDLVNLSGIAGQNSPEPARKVFDLHVITKVLLEGGLYYDPAYGIRYDGNTPSKAAQDFEKKSVFGYALTPKKRDEPTVKYVFKPAKNANGIWLNNIKFEEK